MLKKKSLKTILIIFALITAIGVTSSLFGGSRPRKTSSGSSSGSSNIPSVDEEINLPMVTVYFETYEDWLAMEDPEDTVNCPAFAYGDDTAFLADSLFYVKSEYVEVYTDYIWIKDCGYGDPNISNEESCELVDEVIIDRTTYWLYHITEDCTISIYISI